MSDMLENFMGDTWEIFMGGMLENFMGDMLEKTWAGFSWAGFSRWQVTKYPGFFMLLLFHAADMCSINSGQVIAPRVLPGAINLGHWVLFE